MKLRIAFVHDAVGKLGGAESNILQVARALGAKDGIATLLLHGEETGIGVEDFREPFERCVSWRAEGWRRALAETLAWQPDVIYVHKLAHLDLLEALTQAGIPLVRMMHDHDIYCQRGSRYFPWNRKICTKKAGYHCAVTCGVIRNRGGILPVKLAWPAKKLREIELSRRFDLNLTVADYMSEQLILHGFDPSRIVVHPPAPAESGIEKISYREKMILFVGQVLRGKGVDLMLKALKQIEGEEWIACIAGSGSHLAYCQGLSRKLGLESRVHFTGRLEKEQLDQLYRRARLGVVPSVWPEPMPLVGYEFMIHAIPVVGFDAGGISHWLKDGDNGLLVPVHDTNALAAAINRLLHDEDEARQMGCRGQRFVAANHRFPQYIDRLLSLLHSVTHPAPDKSARKSPVTA